MIQIAPYADNKTYDEALLYCQFLDHHGHSDWRMPTMDEYINHPDVFGWYLDQYAKIGWILRITPVRDV